MEKRRKRCTGNGFEDHVSKETKRKKLKPITEKLRRERINNSLEELKLLILSAMNEDVSHYAKMEKADILEMTVKYIKRLQTEKPKQQGKCQAQCPSQSSDSNRTSTSPQNELNEVQPKSPCPLDLVLPKIPESAVFQSVIMDTPSLVETGDTVQTNHAILTSCSRSLANGSANGVVGANGAETQIEKKAIFSYSDKIDMRRAPFSVKEQNTINDEHYKKHLSPNRVAVKNHAQNVRLPGMECFIKNNFKHDIFSRESIDKENTSFDAALSGDQYHSGWQMAFDDSQYSLWRPW